MADDGSLAFRALMKGVNEIYKHTFPLQQHPWDRLILHSLSHQLSGCLLKKHAYHFWIKTDTSFGILGCKFLCCKEEREEPLWCGS